MSGVADVLDGIMPPRREVAVSPPSTLEIFEIVETSMLASLSERHRITKAGLKFADLTNKERKQFYKEAVDHVVNCPTANLTAFEAAMRVAMLYNIVVADCDRGRIKTTVNSRLVAAKEIKNLAASIPSDAPSIANDVVVHAGEKRRRAATARHAAARQNADDDDKRQLPSCKLQRPFKGAVSHLYYQECLKEAATVAALKYTTSGESNVSGNAVVREMQASLATLNIEISKSTCWTHLRAALTNNGVAVSPQKPGGVSLPSHIEKKIAKIVRGLRARKFPVFASDVINWTAEEIKDTEYAKYFVNGEPTEG